jgi:hypothetical protein
MVRTTTKQAVGDLLALYSPEVRSLALETRTFLLDLIPGAMEIVDTKSRLIGYGFGAGYKDMVCSVMPTKAGITLGIGWASELPDPHKLLEGTGKVHRHVKLKTRSDLKTPALKALLKAAMARREKLGMKTA